MSRLKDIAGKIGGFLLLAGILFGLFAVVVAPIEMIKKAEAESWSARKAVIITSYARLNPGSGGRTGGGPYWTAEICGKYLDSGEKVCVSRIRYGGFRWGAGKGAAHDTVARYPLGRVVDIYHAPGNPRQTLLEAHSPWTEMFTLFGLGLAFLLLPVGLWLFRRQIDPERYRD